MRCISVFCCLAFLVGCSTNKDQQDSTTQFYNKIETPELIEACVEFVSKAEKLEANEIVSIQRQFYSSKDDPLFAPYPYKGPNIDRALIIEQIIQARDKWSSMRRPLNKIALYVSDVTNLEKLSDGELVIALRLMDLTVSKF